MKLTVILAILLVFIAGCSAVKDEKTTRTISGIQDLMLNEQDLQQLGMTSNPNETYLQQLGIAGNGTDCRIDEAYTNIIDSSVGQYGMCDYVISSLNNADVWIEVQKFANYEALNGSYQYDSSHLYSIEGIMSQNDYGDQSTFRVNNEHDYGGQYNPPGVYFYHLWFTKDLYLIHITSGGRSREAQGRVAEIGRKILSKFGE